MHAIGHTQTTTANKPTKIELAAVYSFHRGALRETVDRLLADLPPRPIGAMGRTGLAPATLGPSFAVDAQVAVMVAARVRLGALPALLLVGGERFALLSFDAEGNYRDSRTSSSCAAGTGSFLDQHAATLGLADSAALAALALGSQGPVPPIASRCAVFAKTDLIHAQQQGYARESICRGLCRGLATILVDTLFAGEPAPSPLGIVGGVARNAAVAEALAELTGATLHIDLLAHVFGAIGAALSARDCALASAREAFPRSLPSQLSAVATVASTGARTFFEPLPLDLEGYPDFSAHRRAEFHPVVVTGASPVEVDIYVDGPPGQGDGPQGLLLGLDIGSTSTKAVLLDGHNQVWAGFYSRTSGEPVRATQAVFEAIDDRFRTEGIAPNIRACATTGAGRKLIGTIAAADLVVDEISAHARAARELCPDVDTIIEIGGQDAKFCTLRDGAVTSAVMNTVCAAGTGSFIEEQARRLDCPLSEYADRVAGARAPLASDRCTVFMQRDVSHLFALGHKPEEVLAAVLHSVRENYLQKVARRAAIGRRICFQGATAKNRALVAAFAAELGQPIAVSRYCHLGGALGAALLLADEVRADSTFRGLDLHRASVALHSERCSHCQNQCRITIADIGGERVAYGFLCDRDLTTERHVPGPRGRYALEAARRGAFRATKEAPSSASPADAAGEESPTIGLPAALYLYDELPLWRRFFAELGVNTITSEHCKAPVTRGKRLARAELCAPMMAWHGHADHLLERADYLFAPVYLEAVRPGPEIRRQYCYYSQYASSLLPTMGKDISGRCLMPIVDRSKGPFELMVRLAACLQPVIGERANFGDLAAAYQRAQAAFDEGRVELGRVMARELAETEDVSVVLLGRPYTCLPSSMNKGISALFAAQGVKVFFQDMVVVEQTDEARVAELLGELHWQYASEMVRTGAAVARRPALYPVIVTSFKCTPDACTLEYLRRLFESHQKPYLVLELDEHDSSVGYETRIEAALRAFRNHHRTARRPVQAQTSWLPPVTPIRPSIIASGLEGKTVFLPSWDRLCEALLVASLNRAGVSAELICEEPDTITRSMRHNTGQCLPLTAMAQGFIDTVKSRGVDPAKAVLWTVNSKMGCNVGMFGPFLRTLLETQGGSFEKSGVLCGDITLVDLSVRAAINTFFAYLLGGYLRKMVCRVRPYELVPGATDRAADAGLALLREAFLGERSKLETLVEVVDRFAAIPTSGRNRPKVALFGDMYSRDNEVLNQDIIRFIEQHGGEVVTTPYSEYVKIVAESYFAKWRREGQVFEEVVSRSLLMSGRLLERRYLDVLERVLGPLRPAPALPPVADMLGRFAVTDRHTGESLDNLLKVFHVLAEHPDLSLFVQVSPAFCCPSLVTEAMSKRIEEETGVPVVTVTYDGSPTPKNDVLVPYLTFPRRKRSSSGKAGWGA